MKHGKKHVNLCSKDFLELLKEISEQKEFSEQKEKQQQQTYEAFRLSSAV